MPEHSALPLAATRAGALRFGSSMLRRFGWFYYATGLWYLLSRLELKEHSANRIRSAHDKGPVVYVLLRRSSLDHLALNAVLNRRRLPLSVWASGVTSFYWQPVWDAWRDVGRRIRAYWHDGRAPDPVHSGWLEQTVAGGAPVTVFIEGTDDASMFDAIVAAQQQAKGAIQLVPVVVVWDRSPQATRNGVRQWFEGSRERPSAFGRLRSVLLGKGDAFVQAGEPVDLPQVIERVPAARRSKALHVLLRRYLARESRAVRGPHLLPRAVMRRLVLDDPPMRALAAEEARATGTSPAKVRKQMERTFDTIAANFRWWMIRLLDVVLKPLWTKVFNGVDVPDEDMERIRTAIRDGSAILVPSHKSHFDYLLLSWVLYNHDLVVPHVVAGINLKIPGVAFFLRRAGGFFIQRSFGTDRIFPAVFSRYLRELVRQGYPIEFFIEGGRTRSGKLMPPKLGVLGMVVDAATARRPSRKVTLLPIALAYEQVAEEAAYARELGGADKAPESIGQVVKASRVIRKRYGRLYLRVGEPIDLGEVADGPWAGRSEPERRPLLQQLGERVIHRIGEHTVVLPSSLVAMALLAHNQRGIRQADLVARVERFRHWLDAAGARSASSLSSPSRSVRLVLDRFASEGLVTDLAADDGARVWVVDPERRLTLEFYKNQVVHWFAPMGLASLALRHVGRDAVRAADLLPAFCDAIWTLRREFILDPDTPASDLLTRALDGLVAHGALTEEHGAYSVADLDRMSEIYALFRGFAEAYVTVLSHGADHCGGTSKAMVRSMQRQQEVWLANGTITRPESLSLVTLDNAIRAFHAEEVVRGDLRDSLSVDPDRAAQRLSDLAPWTRPVNRQ